MAKSVPLRMCCVCRQSKEKKELIRVVRTKDGQVFIDPTGKAAGRGAYLCRSGLCASEAEKKKALERSFKAPVGEDVFSALASHAAHN